MKNKHGDRITEGMIVRLRKDKTTRPTRRISAQVIGWVNNEGGVRVIPALEGHMSGWHIDDLEPVPGRNG